MSKPKGTPDKATLQKWEKAASQIVDYQEKKNELYKKLNIAEALITASEQRAKEIRTQIRTVEKTIAGLEKMKAQWEAREKKENDLERIKELINSLVDQGIPAAEIIKKLEEQP